MCLIYPLYLPGATCFATGLDANNSKLNYDCIFVLTIVWFYSKYFFKYSWLFVSSPYLMSSKILILLVAIKLSLNNYDIVTVKQLHFQTHTHRQFCKIIRKISIRISHTIYWPIPYAFMLLWYAFIWGIMYLGVRHIKVIPADKGKCGIDETNPYDSCIEYVGEDKDTMCLVSLL